MRNLFAGTLCVLAMAMLVLVNVEPAAAATIGHAVSSAHGLDVVTAMGLVGTGLSFKNAGSAEPGDLADISKKLSNVTDQVKSFAEDVAGKLEKGETLSTSMKEQIDEALSGMRERGLARKKPAARKREPVEGEVHGDGSGEPLPEVTEDPVTSGPHIDPEPAE